MKKITQPNKLLLAGFSLICFMAVSSSAMAQFPGQFNEGRISNESGYLSNDNAGFTAPGSSVGKSIELSDVIGSSQIIKADMASKVETAKAPDIGKKLKDISLMIFEYIVVDDGPAEEYQSGFSENNTVEAVDDGEEIELGLALTSSYINNQLMSGMQLEFHANPMAGGGAIMLKKMF